MNDDKKYSSREVALAIEEKLNRYFGISTHEASTEQLYRAVALTVKDILSQKKSAHRKRNKGKQRKKIYYMCMEFLIGRSLKNHLYNLGLEKEYEKAINSSGHRIEDIYECESDAGLGNGGLGRLAACFLDSMTALDYPAYGFSICYEYGLFKQKIVDGNQVELPDEWMASGDSWLSLRTDKSYTVKFGGHVKEVFENGRMNVIHENCDEVCAVPYDVMVSGYQTDNVGTLRLWRAKDMSNFNMSLFSQGEYVRAMQQATNAEIISKVLYPSDEHTEGKLLRLSQQYFLVSASLQSIISDHLKEYGTLSNISDRIVIHINDTHPALCVPEFMRILMDVHSYSWDDAWRIVTRTVTYTNHTVMPEALECWNVDLFRLKLPRIYSIVEEINRRFCSELLVKYPGDFNRTARMAIISNSQVRMANLSVYASNKVNGVSKLHSNILKKSVFSDFAKNDPEKFTSVTNGIAHRRWLCMANPALSCMIDELIGKDYRKDPEALIKLKEFSNDIGVQEKLLEIKKKNKLSLSEYLGRRNGIILDPDSVFDVQVKRIHEYKRQLLNVLKIIAYYNDIENGVATDIPNRTFIFGGKAAPGYYMAKEIIKLICALSADIDKNEKVGSRLKVAYIENYDVTTAEHLMPASDISEQISLAGKEASGTGCMKFMINGALTIGTLDGANVEIIDAVGADNAYMFGLRSEEVDETWKKGYHSAGYYNSSERLKDAVDRLYRGFNGVDFSNIASYLLSGNGGVADPYMCLADFDSYCLAYSKCIEDYTDQQSWAEKSLINIASAGYFSADRSIKEYAKNIWNAEPYGDEK